MITIDLDSKVSLTDQIILAIRRAIAEGRVVAGDELPTVRQIAADLEVNFNTVARAYRALEASGLVRTFRRRGTRVVATEEADPASGRRNALTNLRSALADARLAGLPRKELERFLGREVDALWLAGSGKEK